MASHFILLGLLFFCFFFSTHATPSCVFRASDGSAYNLKALSRQTFYNYNSSQQYSYYINICDNVHGSPVAQCNSRSPVCQVALKVPQRSFSDGNLYTQEITDLEIGAPNKGVTISYSRGDFCGTVARSTKIHLLCNPAATRPVVKSVVETSLCKYAVQMESQLACPFDEQLCQYQGSDGSQFDLRSLILPDRGSESYSITTPPDSTFFINICGVTARGNCTHPTPVCQAQGKAESFDTYSCGSLSTQSLGAIDENEPARGILLSYTNGDQTWCPQKRNTTISIHCDLSEHGLAIQEAAEPKLCQYSIKARSSAACPTSLRTCTYQATDGSHYNLQPMYKAQKLSHPNGYMFDDSGSGWNYTLNICGNVDSSCGHTDPICQYDAHRSFSLGALATQQFGDHPEGHTHKGVTISYSSGDSCFPGTYRQTSLILSCNPGQHPGRITKVVEDPICNYKIYIDSAYACPL